MRAVLAGKLPGARGAGPRVAPTLANSSSGSRVADTFPIVVQRYPAARAMSRTPTHDGFHLSWRSDLSSRYAPACPRLPAPPTFPLFCEPIYPVVL
jgi:hypothetical protein